MSSGESHSREVLLYPELTEAPFHTLFPNIDLRDHLIVDVEDSGPSPGGLKPNSRVVWMEYYRDLPLSKPVELLEGYEDSRLLRVSETNDGNTLYEHAYLLKKGKSDYVSGVMALHDLTRDFQNQDDYRGYHVFAERDCSHLEASREALGYLLALDRATPHPGFLMRAYYKMNHILTS